MSDLKPCPFCGVQPKLETEGDDDGYEYGGAWEYASISAIHKKTCPLYISAECGENSGSIQIENLDGDNVQEFIKAWNTRPQLDGDREAALKEISETIRDTLDGKNPMSKWSRHTAVKTIDDLEWFVKSNLKECLILQAATELKDSKEDMTDWALGKQSAFDAVLQNIHQIKEQALQQQSVDVEALEDIKRLVFWVNELDVWHLIEEQRDSKDFQWPADTAVCLPDRIHAAIRHFEALQQQSAPPLEKVEGE
jgi:hypothetical protein